LSDLEPYLSQRHAPVESGEEIDRELTVRGEAAAEREGLPRSYQMRADSHYVDALESHLAAPAIRMIPTRQIDVTEPLPTADLEVLTRSIAANGIVQPLLVRRHNRGFQLIAGRKRLAAAISCRLAEVPCLVHDADTSRAAALAAAENVRSVPASQGMPSSPNDPTLASLHSRLLSDVARMNASATLLKGGPGNWLQPRVASDLIQAQAWRTSWLLNASLLAGGTCDAGKPSPVAAIFDRVVAGFEPEARLRRMQLRVSVARNASSAVFDDQLGVVAVTSAVIVTLGWLDRVDEPIIELRADAPNPPAFRVEIAQRMVRAPSDFGELIVQPDVRGPGDVSRRLAARILRLATVESGGTAEVMAIKDCGSVIQCTFVPNPPG
jgi:ParB-like nuclease domain